MTGRAAVIDRGLLECDFGEWTGAELAKLAKLPEWRSVQRYPSGWRFPGGESFVELQSRLVEASDRLRAQHPGEVIVAVSHADCIKAVLASALGVPLDLFQRIMVGTCSTSVVAYGVTGPMVLAMNSYAPMARLLPGSAHPAPTGAGGQPGEPAAPKVSARRRSRRSTSAATDGS